MNTKQNRSGPLSRDELAKQYADVVLEYWEYCKLFRIKPVIIIHGHNMVEDRDDWDEIFDAEIQKNKTTLL